MTRKKNSDGKNKKSPVKKAAKTIKEAKKVYSVAKKAMWFITIFAAVFGISFTGSFFTKPDSALSTVSYEIYDIVYEIFSDFDNLEYGIKGHEDSIIKREGYALGYSDKFKQPLWVCYNLTADELEDKNISRNDDFRSDWRLWGKSAQLEDYQKSNYDRGHLAPAADMAWSDKAMSQSFFLSNMSPQNPSLNRGTWRKLESNIRKYAKKFKKIHVITGPVFYNTNIKYIGKSRVAVPDAYYKIVYAPAQHQMIGFIIPNEDADSSLAKYAVNIYAIEDATQLEFFMNISPDVRRVLKEDNDIDFWGL